VAAVARAWFLPALCAQIDEASNTNHPARVHIYTHHGSRIRLCARAARTHTTNPRWSRPVQPGDDRRVPGLCHAAVREPDVRLLRQPRPLEAVRMSPFAPPLTRSYDEPVTTTFPINRGMENESLRPLKCYLLALSERPAHYLLNTSSLACLPADHCTTGTSSTRTSPAMRPSQTSSSRPLPSSPAQTLRSASRSSPATSWRPSTPPHTIPLPAMHRSQKPSKSLMSCGICSRAPTTRPSGRPWTRTICTPI
jgi:hypothetical protein